MRRSGTVLGLLLLASLLVMACKRGALRGEDGGGQGGVGGNLVLPDAAAGMGGQDARAEAGRDALPSGMDAARDSGVDVEPPSGSIPCGGSACDPAREFCKHDVTGLTIGQRSCWPLPTGCAPGGTECGCLLYDAGWFCSACRVVSGAGAMGLELDCPGAQG